MTGPVRPRSHTDDSLRRVRVRLTAWYAGTFTAILLVLGTGMFATITRRYDHELDESLRDTAGELIRVLQAGGASDVARVFGPTQLRVPDRFLHVTDADGRLVAGDPMPAWMEDLARQAARSGPTRGARSLERPGAESAQIIRAYAAPLRLGNGVTLVVVTAADEIEIEDRYAALILTFSIAAVAGLMLVAAGGWVLARQSTAPIERSILRMRQFMADAAHELRTPLTILRSRAEVTLQRPREAGEYISALQAVERESARLGGIVEDLLMLARADSGERPIERKRIFLDEVVFDAAEPAQVIARRRSIRMEFGDLPETPIDGDALLLMQLVIILLDNAVKYTPPGGTVRVELARDAETATLAVTDTGIGIATEHLPHVFDRFYRADAARSRDDGNAISASEGVGLGLSIARWIAEQHGARIDLAPSPGGGTAATARFPLAAGARD